MLADTARLARHVRTAVADDARASATVPASRPVETARSAGRPARAPVREVFTHSRSPGSQRPAMRRDRGCVRVTTLDLLLDVKVWSRTLVLPVPLHRPARVGLAGTGVGCTASNRCSSNPGRAMGDTARRFPGCSATRPPTSSAPGGTPSRRSAVDLVILDELRRRAAGRLVLAHRADPGIEPAIARASGSTCEWCSSGPGPSGTATRSVRGFTSMTLRP